MHPMFTNIGSFIKTSVNVQNAALAASATANGTSVQLVGTGYDYKSAQMTLNVGALGGSPTGTSIVCQLQDSDTGTSDWANFNDLQGHGTITITAASTAASDNVILQGTRGFVRLTVVNALTGGSSPTSNVVATLVIGGTSEFPAV